MTVEQCVRTGVVLGDLVSMCKLVNSQALDVHVTGHVPTIEVIKCDDVQVRSMACNELRAGDTGRCCS